MIPLQRFAAGPRVLGLAIAVAGMMGAPKARADSFFVTTPSQDDTFRYIINGAQPTRH